MMIKNFIKIAIVLLFTLISKNALAEENAVGEATELVITITKIELCETGSTITNCLNPIDITTGSGGSADIGSAAISPGQAAASIADFGKAKLGKTYTHIQTILSREMIITGTAGLCKTKASTVGSLGGASGGAAIGHTGTAASTTLFVPHFSASSSFTMMEGSNSDGSALAPNSSVRTTDTHFRTRQSLSKSYSPVAGLSPTVFLAFDTSIAVKELDDASCTDAGLQAAAPTATLTIQGQ